MAERSPEVDAYIAGLSEAGAAHVSAIREALHTALPNGTETIRYGMPAIVLATPRYAIHFAGWKAHAAVYPVPDLGGELETEVAPLRRAKDTVAFRYRDAVPTDLVTRIGIRFAELRG